MRWNRLSVVIRTFAFGLATLTAPILVVSQTDPSTLGSAEWVRLQSESGDISIALPADEWIMDVSEGDGRVYRYVNDINIYVSMKSRSGAKGEFRKWADKWWKNREIKRYEFDDFLVAQESRTTESRKANILYTWLYLASSKGAYTVSVRGKDTSLGFIKSTLASLQLNQKQLFTTSESAPRVGKIVRADTLKTSQLVSEALNAPDSKQSKLIDTADSNEKIVPINLDEPAETDETGQIYSRQLILLRHARAVYPITASQKGRSSVVRLNVEFMADGTIGKIRLLETGGRDFDIAAFKAAKKNKFLPALVNGKPVNVNRVIVHSFNITDN